MAKKLGIDLGSASLGWFIREDNQIIKNGVVTFSTGMKLGTGGYSSPTKDRREARSKRRLIQARKYRKIELLKILVNYGYVPLTIEELQTWSKYKKGQQRIFPETEIFKKWLACDFTYLENGKKYKNPYELRIEAIDNKLSKHEFGRALYHLVQRRGYKDIGEKDNETETQIKRRSESGFQKALEEKRFISRALKTEFLDKGERARNQYPYRNEYEEEFKAICKAQGFDISQNDKKEYKNELVRKLRKAIIWQRPLRSQKGNIGKCTLEPSKPRCPASHPIFEIFRAWSFINTIKYYDKDEKKQTIPLKYKENLYQNLFMEKDKNFKFEEIKNNLDKQFGKKQKYNYPINKKTGKYETSVSGMPVCKGLITIFGDKVKEEIKQLHTYNIGTTGHNIYENYSVYDLWHLIKETDDDHIEDFAVNKLGVKNEERINNKTGEIISYNPIVRFKNSSFSASYADLSLKAMCKIIPFLQEGFLYNDAVLLAKIPEVYKDWENNKEKIYEVLEKSKNKYKENKAIVGIANNLIDKYKALPFNEQFAYKNFTYKLDKSDLIDVKKACINYFGDKTWKEKENREEILQQISEFYQSFFADEKRKYIEVPTLANLIEKEFKNNNIKIDGKELYHHSVRNNLYPAPIFSKKYQQNLLAVPLIDSIKNPMFNKSMSVLRKLINELIVQKYVDENTEIIIEVARELNDNNKRIAIERYQRERRDKREKYRKFLRELKGEDNKNEDDDISKFELWSEQIFIEPNDKKSINKNVEILKEKDDLKRYELWTEQKGQCMYTGKMISITQLFSNEIDIEHTIPKYKLPDNTMANKTVCFAYYNRNIKNKRIPTACPNYEKDTNEGTAIKPRLEKWEEIRDKYKSLYEDRKKPKGNEDEENKNRRIQEKHYYRMHYEYWEDKIARFTAEEIKDSWVRRQLTDTQIVSKYAREFLKTYFKKVSVQKGVITAEFRKIFGFQAEDEIKSRNKHTHHSIDAAVLTLIPTNSSKRMEMLKKMYELDEKENKQYRANPDGYPDFNAQDLIKYIDSSTLIVNYQKDKITEQTYRNVRKRGKLQYLKRKGKFVLDKNENKIPLKAKGATIRGKLFQETFIGKIKDVERDENDKPLRNENNKAWLYKKGKDEFVNVVRKPITEANIEDIVDPNIKNIIKTQINRGVSKNELKDHQGKTIRHVRVKTKAGKIVKERLNYKSKYDYKNKYYAAAGEIPYAIFLTKTKGNNIERKMIPVPIHEIAQTFKEYRKFTPELYLKKIHQNIGEQQDIKLLKVGQKVFVLKNDNEFEKRFDKKFQINRMYKITQFSEGNIWLKYHLEARDLSEIKKGIKNIKSEIIKEYEKQLNLSEIVPNESIENKSIRIKDFEDKMFKLNSLKDYRLNRIKNVIGKDKTKNIIEQLKKHKAFSSKIELEGQTPLLKTSSSNWNFLFENYDFEIDIIGNLTWLDE